MTVKKPRPLKASTAKVHSTTSEFADWKTGKIITAMSQDEKRFYHILRWQDEIQDIQAQYPLRNDLVDEIIKDLEESEYFKPDPFDDNREPLTTDFFCTMRDGTYRAYQVKDNPEDVSSLSDERRVYIEKLYFKSLGIPWRLIFAEDIDIAYADNIKSAVRYYDEKNAHDYISKYKHLVATKQIDIDLRHGLVDWTANAKAFFGKK